MAQISPKGLNSPKGETVIVTTTPSIENCSICRYLGVVHTEIVLSVNIITDIMADVREVFGGRVKAFESKFEEATQEIIIELQNRSAARGGNAVIGLDLSWSIPGGSRSGFLLVCGSGTAVVAIPDPGPGEKPL